MSEPYVPYRSASERMREEVDALLEEEGEEEPSSQVSELADDIAGLFDVDADETAVSADVTLRGRIANVIGSANARGISVTKAGAICYLENIEFLSQNGITDITDIEAKGDKVNICKYHVEQFIQSIRVRDASHVASQESIASLFTESQESVADDDADFESHLSVFKLEKMLGVTTAELADATHKKREGAFKLVAKEFANESDNGTKEERMSTIRDFKTAVSALPVVSSDVRKLLIKYLTAVDEEAVLDAKIARLNEDFTRLESLIKDKLFEASRKRVEVKGVSEAVKKQRTSFSK